MIVAIDSSPPRKGEDVARRAPRKWLNYGIGVSERDRRAGATTALRTPCDGCIDPTGIGTPIEQLAQVERLTVAHVRRHGAVRQRGRARGHIGSLGARDTDGDQWRRWRSGGAPVEYHEASCDERQSGCLSRIIAAPTFHARAHRQHRSGKLCRPPAAGSETGDRARRPVPPHAAAALAAPPRAWRRPAPAAG